MIFTPTKVMLVCWALFLALLCWVGANDSKSPIPNPKIKPHGAFHDKVEKNGWGQEGTEELMDGEAKIHTSAVKGEDELNFIDPIHYRSKRTALSWSKYFARNVKTY